MKKIIFILALSSCIHVYAQSSKNAAPSTTKFPIDSDTQLVTYTEVVKVDGLDKAALYDKAQEWAKVYFKNPAQVIKQADKDAGTIELYYAFYCTKNVKGTELRGDFIHYTTTLQFRDGRFKYTISKINADKVSYYGIENWLKPEFADDVVIQSNLQQISKFMDDFIAAMKKGITPSAEKKEDNW